MLKIRESILYNFLILVSYWKKSKVLDFQKDFPNEIIDFGLLWAIFFLVKGWKQFIESKGRNSIRIGLRRINRFFVQRSFHDQVDNQRNMS